MIDIQVLPFEIDEDSEHLPAVGLVVLQTDETMEHELRLWLPDSIRLFHSRIPNSVDISNDSLQQMKQALPASVALLPSTTPFRVIVYGCTSATTVIGEQAVSDAVRGVFPGVAVSNPLSAIKAQLDVLQVCRPALLTPYVPEVSRALIDALQTPERQLVSVASFNESRDDRVARIARSSLMHSLDMLARDGRPDAIVASCTNLRTHGLIEEASQRLGIPVISSNSALAWHVLQLLDMQG
ncbi:maleate cis-trans isomerase family protein [Granulosicoccus sp. 3-233]|uniref:maleate cis-trans isomerase family protein n=1 Tax=Granulosicoccus sp. 3-233 TaxID=3417969 RepID=UPI003D325E83